ncbi:MAG: CHAT domain-containing protein [Cyanobacteria bacterium J06649_4]
MPEECRRAAQGLANLYTQAQDWAEAVTVYEIGLRAVDALYQSAALLDSKASVLTETTDLYRRATYALARNGSFNQTVETIERGRARSLSEILNRDRASLVNLQDIRFDLYTQYISMVRQIRGIETKQRDRAVSQERHSITPETLMEHAATLHHQLKILIQEIREVPGYKSFLSLSTFNDVQKAAHIDCPLIYLLSTPDGSLALIVTPQDSQSIFLDGFAEEQLRQILQAWFLGYKQAQNEVTASSFKNCQPWLKTIDSVTEQIWETLMQPLTHHLKSHNFNRAILIPTGYLNLLPLHAAWTEDKTCSTGRRYAFDEIHFIYAPNAKSFTASRAITKRVQAQSILAIDNPQADLPNSEREVNAAICSFSDRTILRHYEATVAAVKAQLSAASVAHFSCHGTANLTEPLNSGLLMHDGLLTLKDIFALNLVETGGLRLAVLSACETGLQGIENADEAISLPTGLLQAGVAAVISSLWSVSDLSTMMLLTRFYDFWRTEGLEISQALRQAQQWVRDTTNGEKAAYFKDFVPTQSVSKMPASTADHLYKSLILSDPNARDFAHPFHWAAFSYTGA